MYRFLTSRRYVNVMFAIDSQKSKNISQLSKESGMTGSHLTIVMRQWEKEGVIEKIKSGREYDIVFTEKGKKFLALVREFDRLWKMETPKVMERKDER